MRTKKELLLSFFIYGLGLLAMILADIYVSVHFSKPNVAEWAFFKSCILIIGSFCLLGYDQVFVRDPSLIKRVFKKFLVQSFVISFGSSLIIFYIKQYTINHVLLMFGSIFLFSFLSYFSAASRANFNLWKSQFATNFWKFFLILFVLALHDNNVIVIFFWSILLSVVLSFFLKGFHSQSDQTSQKEIIDAKSARNIGFAFLVHNITLILAIYGEQFLINLSEDIVTSEHLFKYVAIFTPIALSINGFLGFYYGPKVRKENNMNIASYLAFTKRILTMSIATTALSIICGFIFMIFYSKVNIHSLDLLLILSLSIMCLARGVYTSTSVCLGVFGSAKTLQHSATYSMVSTIGYILAIFIILHFKSGIIAAQFISLASLCNWLFRLYISNSYTLKTLRALQDANR